jgi:hypothetical protein
LRLEFLARKPRTSIRIQELTKRSRQTWALVACIRVLRGTSSQVSEVPRFFIGHYQGTRQNQNQQKMGKKILQALIMMLSIAVSSVAQISGTLRYDNTQGTPLTNSIIYLRTPGDSIVDSTTTDASGNYLFNGIPFGTYKLTASTSKPLSGINSADALIDMQHYVGTTTLTGLKLLAGDVNGAGNINSIDALLIMKRFVGLTTTFSVGDWIFEEPTVEIIDSSTTVVELKGICTGDVNGSYVAPTLYAYLIIEPYNDRTNISAWMQSQGSTWRGFWYGIPSFANPTTFNNQLIAYINYPGWGTTSPAIRTAAIPIVSGGFDNFGNPIQAFKFITHEVPYTVLPANEYAWYTWIVSTEATNDLKYGWIQEGTSPSGLNNFAMTNYYDKTVNYLVSSIPPDIYRIYTTNPNDYFKFMNMGGNVYFRGGGLVP